MTVQGWFLLLLLPFLFAPKRPKDPAEEMYFMALESFDDKKWSLAKERFEKTLSLLKKRKTPTEQSQHLLTLGRCDIFYHLALLEEQFKQPRKACRLFDRLLRDLKSVPQGWDQWKINRLLPGRFLDANTRFGACATVPSVVSITGLPKGATVELQMRDAQTSKISWKASSLPMALLQEEATIRVQAPDYLPEERSLKVARWTTLQIEMTLKKRPIVRRIAVTRPVRIPPRRLEPIKPKEISPWVWVAVGGGAAVIIAGVVTVAVLASQPLRLQPVLCPSDGRCKEPLPQ